MLLYSLLSAEAAGLSPSAVKKIEQGTLGQLRLETAHRLAVALGTTTLAIADPDHYRPALRLSASGSLTVARRLGAAKSFDRQTSP